MRFLISTIVVVSFALLSACATIPETTTTPGTPAGADRGNALEQAGDLQGAAKAYLDAAANLTSPQREDLQLRAAAALIKADEPAQAQQILDGITAHLPPNLMLRRQTLLAHIALADGRFEQALQLAPVPSDSAPANERASVLELRARAYQGAGNLLESARTRVQLDPLLTDPDRIHANRQSIWNLLSQLSPQALSQLNVAPPPDVLGGWMSLALLMKQTPLAQAKLDSELDAWRSRYPDHPADSLLPELLSQRRQAYQRPEALALLLPLSGPLADAGAAIRDGFLTAYYARHHGPNSVVRVYDTGGNSSKIWNIYSQAVKDGADVIVGPLSKDAVNALARGGKLEVPVLALNYTEDATAVTPDNFYQFGLAPEDEASQIAERASLEGLYRAIALVPMGDWGSRVLAAFEQRFTQLGGQVQDAERYNPANSDYSDPIQRALNLQQSEARYHALRRITGQDIKFEPRRRQDVDFVFMAAFPQQARLIAPQLRFFQAADLPVYATSHAYSGTPDPREDGDMDGVVICDIPWALSGQPPADPQEARIEQLWPQRSQRFLRLYALGADGYNVLPYLTWLQQQPYERFAGATGSLNMDANRRIHRTLRWARFVDGEAQPLRENPIPARATPATGTTPEAGNATPATAPATQPPAVAQ